MSASQLKTTKCGAFVNALVSVTSSEANEIRDDTRGTTAHCIRESICSIWLQALHQVRAHSTSCIGCALLLFAFSGTVELQGGADCCPGGIGGKHTGCIFPACPTARNVKMCGVRGGGADLVTQCALSVDMLRLPGISASKSLH